MTATMTTPADLPRSPAIAGGPRDHRGSWIPTWRMIAARWTELRKRRGLMLLLAGVTIGLPTLFLGIRLVLHWVAPNTYGPAGGFDVYAALVAGVLYLFGFIVAATLGATAGAVDLTEGMFRHHVITGRSRVALYLARIPAGLGIIVPMVAAGFAVVCIVCSFAAPRTLTFDGMQMPAQLSKPAFEHWAGDHAEEVVNSFPFFRLSPADVPNSACLPGGGPGPGPIGFGKPFGAGGFAAPTGPCTDAQLRSLAVTVADENYADYSRFFLSPSMSLMIKTGLWIELEVAVAFLVGLGLASLLGQRTVAVVLMIVLELIITSIAIRSNLPHMINLQRAILGAATQHLEPGHLPSPYGGNSPVDQASSLHETTPVAVSVIIGWVVVWTGLGAWRMAKRDV